MGPAGYVIAILGCGEGNLPCEQVRMIETQYETHAACTRATEAALMRADDVNYPVVVAQCRQRGAAADQLMPADVAIPAADPTPLFRPAGARTQLAGRAR